MTNSLLLNMVHLEIVDLPFLKMVMFHSYVSLPEGIPGCMDQDNQDIYGWWLSPTPLKNMKISWDDDYSQYMEK